MEENIHGKCSIHTTLKYNCCFVLPHNQVLRENLHACNFDHITHITTFSVTNNIKFNSSKEAVTTILRSTH